MYGQREGFDDRRRAARERLDDVAESADQRRGRGQGAANLRSGDEAVVVMMVMVVMVA